MDPPASPGSDPDPSHPLSPVGDGLGVRVSTAESVASGELDILDLALKMRAGVEVRDRTYHLKRYTRCFIGSEAVAWLLASRHASNIDEALFLGNCMLDQGMLEHVTNDHAFKNARLFYRFAATLDHMAHSKPAAAAAAAAGRRGESRPAPPVMSGGGGGSGSAAHAVPLARPAVLLPQASRAPTSPASSAPSSSSASPSPTAASAASPTSAITRRSTTVDATAPASGRGAASGVSLAPRVSVRGAEVAELLNAVKRLHASVSGIHADLGSLEARLAAHQDDTAAQLANVTAAVAQSSASVGALRAAAVARGGTVWHTLIPPVVTDATASGGVASGAVALTAAALCLAAVGMAARTCETVLLQWLGAGTDSLVSIAMTLIGIVMAAEWLRRHNEVGRGAVAAALEAADATAAAATAGSAATRRRGSGEGGAARSVSAISQHDGDAPATSSRTSSSRRVSRDSQGRSFAPAGTASPDVLGPHRAGTSSSGGGDGGGGGGDGGGGGASGRGASDEERKEMEAARRMIESLASDWSEAPDTLQEDYVASVMTQPDSKKPGRQRTFSIAAHKLTDMLAWRRSVGADSITPASVARQLQAASLYWHGYDKLGRPVLWVRPHVKDYGRLDVDKEIQMHVLMLDAGIRLMPRGVTEFCLIADSSDLSLRKASPALMRGLLKILVMGYPDRLGRLYVGPLNRAVQWLYSILTPFMPKRLPSKIQLMGTPADELLEVLEPRQIPTYFGGPDAHGGVRARGGEFSWDAMLATQRAFLARMPAGGGDGGASTSTASAGAGGGSGGGDSGSKGSEAPPR